MEKIIAMFKSEDNVFLTEIQSFMRDGKTAEIIKAAAKKGFDFTEAEWKEYLNWSSGLPVDDKHAKQELAEEELEAVAGGKDPYKQYEPGSPDNPILGDCWFHAASEPEFRDGMSRKRCNQFACKTLVIGKGWCQCVCWGTSQCVGNWHRAEGRCLRS
jgi:predicted ribosomally synthesized peptide with nif11-like leader